MKSIALIFWSIFIAAAALRFAQTFVMKAPDVGDCLKKHVQGIGMVMEEPERKDSGQVLVVGADSIFAADSLGERIECRNDQNLMIRLKTRLYPQRIFGDRVEFSGNLSQLFNFKSDGGRTFDYRGYLAKDNIYYEIKSADVRSSTRSSKFSVISSLLFGLRRNFEAALDRNLGEPQSALAKGLVVGEKAALGNDLLDDFRTVGLIHIVVLSGFNITIVAVAMRRLLSFLPRVWGIATAAAGIALFGILVGGGATVVRSCIMAGITLSADLIRRDYSVHRALALAALVMLIQNPLILTRDPSFQLSFLATLGLILLSGPIESRLTRIPEKFGLRAIVAATFATQIFVSPYILYMLGQLSLVGVFANILVLPLIPVTMLAVFLCGVAGMIYLPLVADIIGGISHILLSYELMIVESFARLPFASIHVPAFPICYVGSFYAALAAGWLARKKLSSMTVQFRLAKKSSI
jgi:competence protein ComEC